MNNFNLMQAKQELDQEIKNHENVANSYHEEGNDVMAQHIHDVLEGLKMAKDILDKVESK